MFQEGGNYSTPQAADFEMGERYLRTILTFFGVKDIKAIAAEKLDVQGIDVNKILNDAIDDKDIS